MTQSREHIIIKLLSSNHLNVIERKELGKLTFSETLNAVDRYFNENRFLPITINTWDDDSLCYEGFSIEKDSINVGQYILHLQVAGPFMNLTKNEKWMYNSLSDALDKYLHKEFNYIIDGIRIMKD